MAQTLAQMVRTIMRRGPLAAAILLTLALGIGVNTALFSVVKAVLIAPLPYSHPESVAMIWSRWEGFTQTWVSVPEYHNYRATLESFDDLALFQQFEANITEGIAERVPAAVITGNMLDVLGVTPVRGRSVDERDVADGAQEAVMVSYGMWQGRFGGREDIVGATISVNAEPRVVVGVLPADFLLPLDFATDRPSQMFLPARLPAPTGTLPPNGGSHGSYVVGRLAPGATVEQANAELAALSARLNEEGVYPESWKFRAMAGQVGEEVAGPIRPALWVLLGAVTLVLLIACANVTNLLLVWSEQRRRETGVRAAIGASPRRLVAHRLMESGLLAVGGVVLGIVIAAMLVKLLAASAPAGLARVDTAAIDGPVLAYSAAIAMFAALLSGLFPALHAVRTNPADAVRSSGKGVGGSDGGGVRGTIVAMQVALAVVLVIGAGLVLRSFWNLAGIDPGFDVSDVVTMRISPNSAYYPEDADVTRYYSRVLDDVRGLPGVTSAGLIRLLPLDTEIGDSNIIIEGYNPPAGTYNPVDWQAVSPGFFESVGARIVAGRDIRDGDDLAGAPVIMVNEAFVRAYFPDGNAIGKQVMNGWIQDEPWQTIVGVVADMRHNGLTTAVKPTFYRPHAQWSLAAGSPRREMTLAARTAGDAEAMLDTVRRTVAAVDSRVPVSAVKTMEQVIGGELAHQRFLLQLLVAFGVLAVVLAIIGVYSVMSYVVATRNREIGIRMALGARAGDVVWRFTQGGLVQSATGVVIGVVVALAATRLLSGLLHDVGAADPLTYAVVAVSLVVVAGLACWIPARRAARIDPMRALREE